MRKQLRVGLATLVVLAAVTSCTSTQVATALCPQRDIVTTLAGPQPRYPGREPVLSGSGIDATDASWALANPYPVSFETTVPGEQADLCFVGGQISSLNGPGTAWATWHDTAGMIVMQPDFELIRTELDNVGDGVRFSTSGATDWAVRGVQMRAAHDDCIENDHMHGGTIDDSFFDGCYVFYSARGPSGSNRDGSANTVTITNSVVRLEPMAFSDLNNGVPGHGPLFKTSANPTYGRSPQFAIRDSVFRFDQKPVGGAQLTVTGFDDDYDPLTPPLPYLDPADCSNNTIVWLGEGPFPGSFPSCFAVTTDPAVWDQAVAAWVARNSS